MNKKIIRGKLNYQLLKIFPKNYNLMVSLNNGIRFILRSRTMDRTVLKEVWVREIYNRHGICVEKGDTVLDVGGHIGIFSVYSAFRSQTGMVYVFEPFIENFERIEKHAQMNHLNNVKAFHKGVTAKTGEMTLFLSPDNNTGGHSMHLKNESEQRIKIQTVNLKEFCTEQKIKTIDFLKMDCEGAEFEILNGDKSILKKVKKIIMECHPYEDNTCDSMVALLEESGFSVAREGDTIGGVEMLYAIKK